MPKIILSQQEIRSQLYPFSLTRHVAQFRVGILTIQEKWAYYFGQEVALAEPSEDDPETISFAANILPSKYFADSFQAGDPDYGTVRLLQYPWHLVQWNDWSIRNDYEILTKNRHSALLPPDVITRNPGEIFVEEGASIAPCHLNASSGPIYIGKHAVILDGAMIQGPVSIGEGAIVKMGARIYGATTIGPYCIAGGEIKNSIMMDYSNKAHDGYLGDAVLGSWCNLGAGTTNSNLKNTGGKIYMSLPGIAAKLDAGFKCGLLMGDYSRAAINTAFNTGTIVGVAANVFGAGLSPRYIPSFSWGMHEPARYAFDKAIDHIANWKKFKQKELSKDEIQTLRYIFDHY